MPSAASTNSSPPEGFALQAGRASHEASAICLHCSKTRTPRRFIAQGAPLPSGWVPVGTVEFVEQYLPGPVEPDYTPEFLAPLRHRRVWFSDEVPETPCWLKPADKYKRFNAFYWRPGDSSPEAPFACSDPLPSPIIHEWRYYAAEGQIVHSGWYDGRDPKTTPSAPEFPLPLPPQHCGAIDIALLKDGRLALIEAHHPFACGWYGPLSEGHTYAHWLHMGWEFLCH